MSKKDQNDKTDKKETATGPMVEEQETTMTGQETEVDEVSSDDRDNRAELETLQRDYEELREKYLRLLAEFDNYKKRTIREKIDLMNTAAGDTLAALLPVLDDFDRAKKIADDPNTGEVFSEGVRLVYAKLYNILRQKGLEPMETDGQPFDPDLHEAFTEIPAPSEELKGHVVDTIEKGYKIKDKIIRHAKVVVGK